MTDVTTLYRRFESLAAFLEWKDSREYKSAVKADKETARRVFSRVKDEAKWRDLRAKALGQRSRPSSPQTPAVSSPQQLCRSDSPIGQRSRGASSARPDDAAADDVGMSDVSSVVDAPSEAVVVHRAAALVPKQLQHQQQRSPPLSPRILQQHADAAPPCISTSTAAERGLPLPLPSHSLQ